MSREVIEPILDERVTYMYSYCGRIRSIRHSRHCKRYKFYAQEVSVLAASYVYQITVMRKRETPRVEFSRTHMTDQRGNTTSVLGNNKTRTFQSIFFLPRMYAHVYFSCVRLFLKDK